MVDLPGYGIAELQGLDCGDVCNFFLRNRTSLIGLHDKDGLESWLTLSLVIELFGGLIGTPPTFVQQMERLLRIGNFTQLNCCLHQFNKDQRMDRECPSPPAARAEPETAPSFRLSEVVADIPDIKIPRFSYH